MRKFKVVNILSGFQNAYDQPQWQVWAIMDDGRRILCEIFKTKKQALDQIKIYKG